MNLCGKYRLSDHQRFDRIWSRSDPSPHPDQKTEQSDLPRLFFILNYHNSIKKDVNLERFRRSRIKFAKISTEWHLKESLKLTHRGAKAAQCV